MGVLVNNEVLWTGYLDTGHEYIETNISYAAESPVKVYKDGVPQILDSDYNLEEYNGNFKVKFPGGFDQQVLIAIVNDFDQDKLPSWENNQINDKRYLNQMVNSLKILFQESKESSELTFKLMGPIKHLSDFLAFYNSDLFKDLNSLLEAVNEWYLEVSKWNDKFQEWSDGFSSSIEEQLEDLIEYLETFDVEHPVYEEYAESDFGRFKVNGVSKLLGSEVVETGETPTGKYIKYANGLMLCYLKYSYLPSDFTIPYNDPITSSDIPDPDFPFAGNPSPHATCLTWVFPEEFDTVLSVSAHIYGRGPYLTWNQVTVEDRRLHPLGYVFFAKNTGNENHPHDIEAEIYFHFTALGTWSP